MTTIGTCSRCGGKVTRDLDGTLTCQKCGARSFGPVIEMPEPKVPYRDYPSANEWKA
jgi:DNA-directed RNA polymerase subunit RPC12/RpoP